MRPLLFLSLCLWLGTCPSFLAAQEVEDDNGNRIVVHENGAPTAQTSGIAPPGESARAYDFAGSDPQVLKNLLAGFQRPLQWPESRRVAIEALSAPVGPDALGSVPENWMALRLGALLRIGEYEAAWNLYQSIPKEALTEPLARAGASIAWLTGRADAACALTRSQVGDARTDFPGDDSKRYWLIHLALCQKREGRTAEADLTLDLLGESPAANLPPLLLPLLQGWDGRQPLPALSSKDALLYPALTGLMRDPKTADAMKSRLRADSVEESLIPTLPPPLLAEWVKLEIFSPAERAAMAEIALRHHLIDGAVLGQRYEASSRVRLQPSNDTAVRRRSFLYMDAQTASADRLNAKLKHAFAEFGRTFAADETRQLLAVPLQRHSAGATLDSIPLLFQHIARDIELGEPEKAWNLLELIGQESTIDETLKAAGAKASFALRLREDDPMPLDDSALDAYQYHFAGPEELAKLNDRYGAVMTGLGIDILDEKEQPLVFSSDNHQPEIDLMIQATARGAQGEAALRSAILLGAASPENTADGVISAVLAVWRDKGLTALARSAASNALLDMPIGTP